MYEVKWRMTNDECRINDEIGMTKAPAPGQRFHQSRQSLKRRYIRHLRIRH